MPSFKIQIQFPPTWILVSSCVLMINYLHKNCQVTKQKQRKLLFMSKEQSLLRVGILFLNKAFCYMSQIIPSRRTALQQTVVEQVEPQRQLGHMQRLSSWAWKNECYRNCFCKDILLLKTQGFKNTAISELFSCNYP